MSLLNVTRKEYTIQEFVDKYSNENSKILNIGSGSTRCEKNCINLDIQNQRGVDVVADAHFLPFESSSFDVCVLCAVLQYCQNPFKVVKEVFRVIKPGGYVIVDAPFVQQYWSDNSDIPDLFRFTKPGLESVFSRYFKILECNVTIAGGSALASYCQGLSKFVFSNRCLKLTFIFFVSVLAYLLSFFKFKKSHEVAGAFVLVAQK